jgi:hypothetical protein
MKGLFIFTAKSDEAQKKINTHKIKRLMEAFPESSSVVFLHLKEERLRVNFKRPSN